jgi:hypothetical protein
MSEDPVVRVIVCIGGIFAAFGYAKTYIAFLDMLEEMPYSRPLPSDAIIWVCIGGYGAMVLWMWAWRQLELQRQKQNKPSVYKSSWLYENAHRFCSPLAVGAPPIIRVRGHDLLRFPVGK